METVGGPGQPDLGVGPAVADHDHGARQAQRTEDDRLAAGLRQGIGRIHARDPTFGVIEQVIAEQLFRRDVEMCGEGGDDLAKAAREDDDPALVLAEEAQVAAHGGRALIEDAGGQFGDMVAGQGQQGQSAVQGLTERQVAGHGLICQGCDFGADRGGVGDPGQGDVGQGLQRLDAHEGGIEIEDIGGRLSHAGTLADLRSCSNSWRRLTENRVQSV